MLPVSGGEQLNSSDATSEWPITSHMVAYSRFVNPAPYQMTAVTFASPVTNQTHPRATPNRTAPLPE